MSVFKEIIASEKLMTVMDLPEGMRTGLVEVYVTPVDGETDEHKKPAASMRGILLENADPKLIPLEKDAWKMHVVKKHGKH